MNYLHVDLSGIFENYTNRRIDHYMLFHTLARYLLNLPFKTMQITNCCCQHIFYGTNHTDNNVELFVIHSLCPTSDIIYFCISIF